MSPIAQVLLKKGHKVSGSDRAYDQGNSLDKFKALANLGCNICSQDGSGMTDEIDILVVSSAVEESIPDVKAAIEKNIKIMKRSDVLSELFNASETGIAVGGTSGKSTVTAMIGHILKTCEKDPSVINGAVMKNASEGLGNAYLGNSSYCVIEADESDGSIEKYTPAVSVLNNITLDHKPMEELRPLFKDFVGKASIGAVINLDDEESIQLQNTAKNTITYGVENSKADLNATGLKPLATGVEFQLDGTTITLQVAGKHNVSNALAAVAAASLVGVGIIDATKAMESFTGVKRRMDIIGTKNNITVIDDFAHNPDKIAATLATLQEHDGRVLAMYQPHGFAPTKMLRRELVEAFVEGMKDEDQLLLPEIYFAGGTVARSISSNDLVSDVNSQNKQAIFFNNRDEIAAYIQENAKKGDRIVIMGARDDTLTDFAKNILEPL